MKLLILLTCGIFLVDSQVPSRPTDLEISNYEEACEIKGITEMQRGLIFGFNIDFNDNLVDVFTRNYQRLRLMYQAYQDNFRRLIFDNEGNERVNWRSRVEYYFWRLRLTTEEMIYEAITGQQQCDQYVVDEATRSINFLFTCRSSHNCTCIPIGYGQSHCIGGIEFYNKNQCVTYTQRVSHIQERLEFVRTSSSLSAQNLIILRDVISRLYKTRNTYYRSLETLKLRMKWFFRLMHIMRIRRRVQYSHIAGRLNVDVNRLITDDEYFEDTVRRPEMWFNDDADEFEIILGDAGPLRNLFYTQDPRGSSNASQQHYDSFGNSRSVEQNLCFEIQDLPILDQRDVEMNTFERTLYGFDSSNQCHRPLTKNEQENLPGKVSRTTEKPYGLKRSKRSASKIKIDIKSQMMDTSERQQLMEFALVSIMDQTEIYSQRRSFQWSKNFKTLYDQYLNDDWTDGMCENSTTGFDTFLYSRLNQDPKWRKCILEDVSIKNESCLAMRRILWDTDSKGKNSWLNKSPRPKQFLKDRATVYKMLVEIPALDQKPNSVARATKDVYLNSDVINLVSIFLTFARINPCVSETYLYARTKRNVRTYNEPVWFLDLQGNIQCI